MNNHQALTILKAYNAWRRQNNDNPEDRLPMPDPKEIGLALEVAINELEGKTEPVGVSYGRLYTPWGG